MNHWLCVLLHWHHFNFQDRCYQASLPNSNHSYLRVPACMSLPHALVATLPPASSSSSNNNNNQQQQPTVAAMQLLTRTIVWTCSSPDCLVAFTITDGVAALSDVTSLASSVQSHLADCTDDAEYAAYHKDILSLQQSLGKLTFEERKTLRAEGRAKRQKTNQDQEQA
jgi:hypothetical protein